jgi:hypothetical protein
MLSEAGMYAGIPAMLLAGSGSGVGCVMHSELVLCRALAPMHMPLAAELLWRGVCTPEVLNACVV